MLLRSAVAFLCIVGAMAAEPLAIGGSAPALAVTALDGTANSVATLRGGGPLLLMSWCSSCHSCRRAEKPFDAMVERYRGRVPAYALAANPAETPALVTARQQASELSFPVVLDRGGAAADALGITCTTTAVILDAAGMLAYRGPLSDPATVAALDAVIAGKQPAVAEVEQSGCPLR